MRLIKGTKERHRLSVFRSNRHMYVQLINDYERRIVTSVSTMTADIKKKKVSNKMECAREIGKAIAAKALKKDVKKVVFDRGKFKYHGLVKALAEGAREGGLEF